MEAVGQFAQVHMASQRTEEGHISPVAIILFVLTHWEQTSDRDYQEHQKVRDGCRVCPEHILGHRYCGRRLTWEDEPRPAR